MDPKKRRTSVDDMSMGGLLAQDADGKREEGSPSEESMGRLAAMVKKQNRLEKEIAEAEESLKKLKKNRDKLQLEDIPDLFDELQMSKFVLSDGTGVEVKRFFVGSITKATEREAFSWLEKRGHSAIIKHDFVIKLKKGEEEQAKEVKSELKLLDVPFTEKEHVHPSTLKSFINEQMENGSDIPQEAFNIYPVRKAIIK